MGTHKGCPYIPHAFATVVGAALVAALPAGFRHSGIARGLLLSGRCTMVRLLVAPAAAVALASAGCGTATVSRPPEAPPTPASITLENPGGDAADPEKAALERLLGEPWGQKRDRWSTLRVPLADVDNWQRVRLWGQPTRVAFRFGDDHYGLLAVWYHPARTGD